MSSITSHYGGTVLAIKGDSSLVLLSDLRVGTGNITTNMNYSRIFQLNNNFILYPSFIPDAQFLHKKIVKNHNLFVLNEEREMEPEELANMVSFILYSKRTQPYFTSPIVAGMGENGPYICGMDCIGCMSVVTDFSTSGTAENNLYGFCESLEKADGEELFINAAHAFVNCLDRDALSGWGCEGFLITDEKVIKRRVKMRVD